MLSMLLRPWSSSIVYQQKSLEKVVSATLFICLGDSFMKNLTSVKINNMCCLMQREI